MKIDVSALVATSDAEFDPVGRFEVGFPLRWWPHTGELQEAAQARGIEFDAHAYASLRDRVNLRWVSDVELRAIWMVLGGLVPIYRSVYRFTRPEHDLNPKERNTAIVDHCFFEFEDQECGVLCQHTMLAVRMFGHWLRRNRMEPQIIYSGGKSLHVYVHTEPVKLKSPHETIRAVNAELVRRSKVRCWDPAANLALAQIARVPNVVNPKTGLHAIPVSFTEVVQRPPSYIHKLAEKPRSMTNAPSTPTPTLAILLKQADERMRERRIVEGVMPPPMVNVDPAECPHFQRILNNGVADGEGRHFALVSVIDFYRGQGLDPRQCRQSVEAWNVKNRPPISPGIVGHQIDAQYRRDNFPPCAILRQRGLHPKGPCA